MLVSSEARVETSCESVEQSVSADLSSEPCGRQHLKCVSHTGVSEEISSSSKFGWGGARCNSGGARANSGGARRNSGGARPNSGGTREGAGRKRKAADELAEARIKASLETIQANAPSGARWYCVQTWRRLELFTLHELVKAKFAAIMPRREVELPDRTRVLRPMWPGYVLVRFDMATDPWQKILEAAGVRKLLPVSDRPRPAPVGLIERLVDELRSTDSDVILRELLPRPAGLAVGQQVCVVDGPFSSFPGIITATEEQLVRVIVGIFGRETEVPMPREWVEPVYNG